eukprot:6202425-Pleurochrysis_carterae.AAC.2
MASQMLDQPEEAIFVIPCKVTAQVGRMCVGIVGLRRSDGLRARSPSAALPSHFFRTSLHFRH